jgi:hypothetical protein
MSFFFTLGRSTFTVRKPSLTEIRISRRRSCGDSGGLRSIGGRRLVRMSRIVLPFSPAAYLLRAIIRHSGNFCRYVARSPSNWWKQ